MYKTTGALLLAFFALAWGCDKNATETPPADEEEGAASVAALSEDEKSLYVLGAILGQRAAEPLRLSEAELEILQRGFAATARGGEPELPLDEWGPKLDVFMKARSEKVAAAEKERGQAFASKAAGEEGAVQTASGLVYRTLEPGQGASPAATDVVRVHYHGTLTDGTVFDSSRGGDPAQFPLNQVIACWTEGVQRMKVGETAQLVCPSDIAYGDGGRAGIPPGATLVFEVELVGIQGR
jgi:FKBP-type peptidyl-prolyl cis-trans isomerase FkpA